MVEPTQREQVVEICLAAIRPVPQVVALGTTRRDTTAGESARGVACVQRQTLPCRNRAAGTPDVDRKPVPFGDRYKFGVAPDAAGDSSRKWRTVLHPTATASGLSTSAPTSTWTTSR
jgi:hypothetical protein